MDLFTFLGEICFLGLFGNDCISLTETTEPGDQFLARGHVLATVKTQIQIILAEYWCNFS